MATSTSKNLGPVSAVYSGTVAPSNKNLIWFDTTTTPSTKKVWDNNTSAWVAINIAPSIVFNTGGAASKYVRQLISDEDLNLVKATGTYLVYFANGLHLTNHPVWVNGEGSAGVVVGELFVSNYTSSTGVIITNQRLELSAQGDVGSADLPFSVIALRTLYDTAITSWKTIELTTS